MNLLNKSRSFVNSNELRQSYNTYRPEHIQFKQWVDNFKFCHTNICDSKVTAYENNLQIANNVDNSQFCKSHHLIEISTKIVNNNAYEKHIIGLDRKSLDRDKYFKVENRNSPIQVTAKDFLKKFNEMSDLLRTPFIDKQRQILSWGQGCI